MAGSDLERFANVDSGFFVYRKRVFTNGVVPGKPRVFAPWGVFREDVDELSDVLEKTLDNLGKLEDIMENWLPVASIPSLRLREAWSRYNIVEFGIWPLVSREVRVGAIVAVRTHRVTPGLAPDISHALMDACAAQISLALDLVLALRIAEEASQRDLLTGLLNRRGLEARLPHLIDEVSHVPGEAYLVFCVMDLDDLKAINDTLGHPAGDDALRKVGEIITRNVRSQDLVCRYGGDEFVLVLASKMPDAMGTAKRIQTVVREQSGVLSVSVGAAVLGVDGNTLDDCYRIADERLYENKRISKSFV